MVRLVRKLSRRLLRQEDDQFWRNSDIDHDLSEKGFYDHITSLSVAYQDNGSVDGRWNHQESPS